MKFRDVRFLAACAAGVLAAMSWWLLWHGVVPQVLWILAPFTYLATVIMTAYEAEDATWVGLVGLIVSTSLCLATPLWVLWLSVYSGVLGDQNMVAQNADSVISDLGIITLVSLSFPGVGVLLGLLLRVMGRFTKPLA